MIKLVLKDFSKAKFDEEGNITEVPEKTYKQFYVTARKLKRSLEMYSTAEGKSELEQMEEMLDHVVDVFDGQFDVDDILDGVESSDLFEVMQDVMIQVAQGDEKKRKLKEKALKAQQA